MKRIFLDNNLWNYFFENKTDILAYFCPSLYELFITKEGFFEIVQSPEKKIDLKNYVLGIIDKNIVKVDGHFGFCNPNIPHDEQRTEGFMGRFASLEENCMNEKLAQYTIEEKRKENLILYKQEADRALGAISACYIVLSFDKEKGPLKLAERKGGKVIFLNYEESVTKPENAFMISILKKVSKYDN